MSRPSISTSSLALKYGCNPHQTPARLNLPTPSPLKVLNGSPSYINILDALGAWQLVNELKIATGVASAASFKHVSPAGAAIAGDLTSEFLDSQFMPHENYSPVARAYIKARGGDRMCSFGDAVSISDPVDVSLAQILKGEVSDLIIAPSYEKDALDILKTKKSGNYLVLQMDSSYVPPLMEKRDSFGFQLEQKRNDSVISKELFQNVVTQNKDLPAMAIETLIVATIALKYAQSNSVCVAYDGQVIGMGAGQQSRIHCTRFACEKAEKWFLQQHSKVVDLEFKRGLKKPNKTNLVDHFLIWQHLSDAEKERMLENLEHIPDPITDLEKKNWIANFNNVCLSSDAFIPFRDNIDRASKTNIQFVAQPGSSLRDNDVVQAANEYGMTMMYTGLRCFLH